MITSTMNSTFALKQTNAGGSGGSYTPGSMVAAAVSVGGFSTGTLLKDMGKTVVSTSRVFRKVKRVITNGPSDPIVADPLLGGPFYVELVTTQSLQAGAFPFIAYKPEAM